MTKTNSLHRTIRSDIERKILSGAWAPGFRIPVEHEFMAQYGCARMTVSKAIATLVEAGLIVRRKRGGSFVAQPHVQSAILDIPDIKADILARGAAYGVKLISREIRSPRGEIEIWLAGRGPLLAVTCLHLANGNPFALEERLISLTSVPNAADADFAETPPGTWLLTHVPWTEAENRIAAVGANRRTANLLHIEPGSACLVIERRTWRSRAHVTHVKQTFPGQVFDLIARFAPAAMNRDKQQLHK
ncbi:MAG TPA: histidine utilization repressor [Rhizomicrobium sp.]|nr:histidine utilization repressor [Rhizomicrobium sp.]